MILGELLARPVMCDGERVGVVVDARFLIPYPDHPGSRPAELIGLLVGQHARSTFLGYERTGVTHPLLVSRWFAHRQKGTFLVDIDDVERIDGVVELNPRFRRWSAMLPD